MSSKTDNIDWATRPGVKLIVADCLGSGFSRTKSGVAELGYDKFIVRAPKNNTSKRRAYAMS
jgi:hypothetical protein